jgi:hypothetical protein
MGATQLKHVHTDVSQSYQQLQVKFNRIYEERVRAFLESFSSPAKPLRQCPCCLCFYDKEPLLTGVGWLSIRWDSVG